MADPAQVKRALAALASDRAPELASPGLPETGGHPTRGTAGGARSGAPVEPDPGPVRVVAAAARAFEDVERAAGFLDGGGEQQLTAAVAVLAERGDRDDLLGRAGHLLAVLADYRRAAAGEAGTSPTADHIHPGRTTLLGGDGLPADR